jgi:hypothetical protein
MIALHHQPHPLDGGITEPALVCAVAKKKINIFGTLPAIMGYQ